MTGTNKTKFIKALIIFINISSLFSLCYISNRYFKTYLTSMIGYENLREVSARQKILDAILKTEALKSEAVENEFKVTGLYRISLIDEEGRILYDDSRDANFHDPIPIEFKRSIWDSEIKSGLGQIATD